MQLNLFEDVENRQKSIEFVVKRLVKSEPSRKSMRSAIKENDRKELIKLFQQSIRKRSFSYIDGYGFLRGVVTDKEQSYKVTARELADMALKIYRK